MLVCTSVLGTQHCTATASILRVMYAQLSHVNICLNIMVRRVANTLMLCFFHGLVFSVQADVCLAITTTITRMIMLLTPTSEKCDAAVSYCVLDCVRGIACVVCSLTLKSAGFLTCLGVGICGL